MPAGADWPPLGICEEAETEAAVAEAEAVEETLGGREIEADVEGGLVRDRLELDELLTVDNWSWISII